jgi:hypothetical protein
MYSRSEPLAEQGHLEEQYHIFEELQHIPEEQYHIKDDANPF